MQRISIHWQFIIAVKNGDGIFFHFCNESFPVVNKNFGI
jgi:hypothetical protein